MLEESAAVAGRLDELGITDHHRVEHQVSEVRAQVGQDLARDLLPVVEHRDEDAEQRAVTLELRLRMREGVHQLGQSMHREELGLDGNQHLFAQAKSGETPGVHARGAVDDEDIQRVPHRLQVGGEAVHIQFLRRLEVAIRADGRQHPEALPGGGEGSEILARAPPEHALEREGRIPLGIEIDERDPSTRQRQRMRQVHGGRRLADPTLLIRQSDRTHALLVLGNRLRTGGPRGVTIAGRRDKESSLQTARTRLGALMRLALAESWALVWPWGSAAASLVFATTLLTNYLCPPFWFVERGELMASQSTAALFLAFLCLTLAWIWSRHRGGGSAWLGRLDASSGLICAEAVGLAMGVGALAGASELINTLGSNMGSVRLAAFPAAAAQLGLLALAPGLARAPLSKPLLVLIALVLVAGELGLLGGAFPLRAGRLWGRLDVDSRVPPLPFPPDLMAALAGLFVSLGLGRLVRRGV